MQIPQECIVEETDVLLSRVMEKIVEVVKHMPQERVHGDTVQDVKRSPTGAGAELHGGTNC